MEIRLAPFGGRCELQGGEGLHQVGDGRCIGADVLESLTPAQMIVKIVNEELTRLMGSELNTLPSTPKGPTVVMLVGLRAQAKPPTARSWPDS